MTVARAKKKSPRSSVPHRIFGYHLYSEISVEDKTNYTTFMNPQAAIEKRIEAYTALSDSLVGIPEVPSEKELIDLYEDEFSDQN